MNVCYVFCYLISYENILNRYLNRKERTSIHIFSPKISHETLNIELYILVSNFEEKNLINLTIIHSFQGDFLSTFYLLVIMLGT
jgi:hypothetical protein